MVFFCIEKRKEESSLLSLNPERHPLTALENEYYNLWRFNSPVTNKGEKSIDSHSSG